MTALHPVPDVVGFSGEVHEYADRWPMRGADEIDWERGPDGYARRHTTPASGKTGVADADAEVPA